MRKNKLYTLLASTLLASNLYGFEYTLDSKKITDNVHCFIGKYEIPTEQNGGEMSNMCFIDEGKYYTTIDSGPSYKYAKQAHEYIKKNHGDKPIKYVLVTHAHDDHYLGNDYFASKGATIVASENFNDAILVNTHMVNMIGKETYEGTKVYGSDIQIKDSSQKFGNIKALSLTPKAHSNSDIVYLDEKNGVIFSGDLIFNGRIPALREGSINGWLEALDKLEKLKFNFIASGHGDITATNAYETTREYLTLLKEKVVEAIDEDIGIEEAAKNIELEKFKNFPLYKELHSKNVFKAYQELEFE